MAKKSGIARLDFPLAEVLDLQQTLKGIAEDVRADVLAISIQEAAKPLVRNIKKRVPVRLGNLKASITAGVRKDKRRGTAKAYVGPEVSGRFKGGKRLNRAKDDLRGADQPSRYAHLVEFGHVNRNGGQTKAKPFMRPGTDESVNQVSAALVVGFQKGLTKVLAKRVKKLSKS